MIMVFVNLVWAWQCTATMRPPTSSTSWRGWVASRVPLYGHRIATRRPRAARIDPNWPEREAIRENNAKPRSQVTRINNSVSQLTRKIEELHVYGQASMRSGLNWAELCCLWSSPHFWLQHWKSYLKTKISWTDLCGWLDGYNDSPH
jgi:hypothetical protein